MSIQDLPTPNEMAGRWDLSKGKSRLEAQIAAKPLVRVTDEMFKKEVRERDRWRCRKCHREVKKTAAHIPERAEVHHVHGRHGVLRHEARCALLLCLRCHEQVTGKVNEKFIIVGTKQIVIELQSYTDARRPVRFEKVV